MMARPGILAASRRLIEVTVGIASNGDDGYLWGGNWFLLDQGSYFGQNSGNTAYGALRFAGVAVPQGAEIVEAELRLHQDVAGGGANFGHHLWGRAHDNAPGWAGAIGTIVRGTASTPLVDTIGPVTYGVTAIVQEVVNRPGWQPNNALGFISFAATTTNRWVGWITREGPASGDPPSLRIVYRG